MHAASSIALKYCVYVPLLALLITSCQKQLVDPAGNLTGGSSSGNLLTKVVSITATDTNTVLFRWNCNNRLVQYLSLGKTNGI